MNLSGALKPQQFNIYQMCLELRKMIPKKASMHKRSKRKFEYYRVNRTLTNRYLNSAIQQM